MIVTTFPGTAVSATVVRQPLDAVVQGLAYADDVAVQAGDEPVVIFGSLDGTRWAPVAHLQADELASMPFVDALRSEPPTATVLAKFPLR